MTQNARDGTELEFPPARWPLSRADIEKRAREARSRVLREFGLWVGAQAAAGTRSLIEAYRSWRRRQAAVFELGSLDDRSLRDLGINRSEIQSVVAGWDATRIPRGQIAATTRAAVTAAPGRTPRGRVPALRKNAA